MPKAIPNHEIAEDICLSDKFQDNLVYIEDYDIFYIWEENHWKMLKPSQADKVMHRYIKSHYPSNKITKSLVQDVVAQVKWTVLRTKEEPDTDYIAFKDCYYNLTEGITLPTNKDIMTTHYIPINYSDIEGCNMDSFFRFLNTSLVQEEQKTRPDADLINYVQEVFGYLLLDSNPVDPAFFLVGEGSNGKSVMTKILQVMIGKEYCSNMSIQELTTDKFATEYLINKKLNVSSEEESRYIAPDKFKSLTGHDMVQGERKFGNKFSFVPRTKYVFASNDLPTFKGMNYGLERRIHLIPFYRKFKDADQDIELIKKIITELPAVIGWALDGLKRLQKNRFLFSVPECSKKELSHFKEEISAPIQFISDCYDIDDDAFISNKDLYVQFRGWCDENGKKGVANSLKFGKEINNNIKGVFRKQHGGVNGKNLRLKNAPNSTEPFEFEDVK